MDGAPRPIASVGELIDHFTRAAKPRSVWRVGVEHEKIGVLAESGMPLPYEGPRGIVALFERLQARGWTPQLDHPGGPAVALLRGDLKMTLEPGGQLELSGAPLQCVREAEREIDAHVAELRDESAPLGIAWLGLGFRPLGSLDDVPWVPKGRYAVMRAYLPTRGALAHEMMKRTATVQANVDWSDEDDAARKLRCVMSVTSAVTAMFACSPIADGRDTGWVSWRARAWLDTDPDRCGLLELAFQDGSVFEKYTEWALDVPMFFVYRGGYQPAGGMTFRRFLEGGFSGERATLADWELHLSTLFPEARFRHYLEVRGGDAGPMKMVHALPALWKGILYDDDACRAATELTADLTFAERVELREVVPRLGLAAPVPRHGTALDLARELVALARAGLVASERRYLDPLDEIVAGGRAPAEAVRDAWHAAAGDAAKFVAATELR